MSGLRSLFSTADGATGASEDGKTSGSRNYEPTGLDAASNRGGCVPKDAEGSLNQ